MAYVISTTVIEEDMLIFSNVLEPSNGEVLWNNDSTYEAGVDNVILVSTHRRYECLQSHSGKNPADPANIDVYWADVAPTNRWAMFDGATSYQTVNDDLIHVILKPGAITALYFAGLRAVNLSMSVNNGLGGTLLKSVTQKLEASKPDNYFDYRFMPFRPQTDCLVKDIPPYHRSHVTVQISGSGKVKCGVMSPGLLRPAGDTQYNSKSTPKGGGRVAVKKGVTSVKKGRDGRDLDLTCYIKSSDEPKVRESLSQLMGTPCLWIGSDLPNYSGLRSYGLADISFTYVNAVEVLLTINVTGILK